MSEFRVEIDAMNFIVKNLLRFWTKKGCSNALNKIVYLDSKSILPLVYKFVNQNLYKTCDIWVYT